jgi:dipeptidyl aminopeptidase/acylaminoacyl peptidase
MRKLRLLGVLVLATATAMAAGAPRRPLVPDDFYRLQSISDPQVSPDGAWVAYVVTTNDRDADEQRGALWMVSWDGREHVPLTSAAAGARSPRFSPDGRYLAYLATPAGAERAQLMLLDRRGGEARALTALSGEIGGYDWSPDGRQIVLAVLEAGDETGAAGRAATKTPPPKPIVISALHFKQDEDGYLGDGRPRRLYLLDVDSKRLELLTREPAVNDDAPAWSPDGERIAFVRTREKNSDPDGRIAIAVVDVRAGATARVLARPYVPGTQRLAWSPDGRRLAFRQGVEPRYASYAIDGLALVDADGGPPRPLSDPLDRAITSYAFAPDSASVLVTIEDDCASYAARLGLDGSVVRLGDGAGVVSDLSAGGGHVAVLAAGDTAPAEVHALEGRRLRRLTTHNDALLAELELGVVEDLRFRSRDGADVHGLLVKPPGFVAGRRYPTILYIHGGPNAQDEHSLDFDSYQFRRQMLAARGYVVFGVNYRGSSGRGNAFARAIVADWGHKEVDDLLAGVDRVVALGLADPQRLGIGGWSYGGILTDYTIATDRRFKAAVSGAGSANQLAMYGTDQYTLTYNAELGPPWRNSALWLKVSYPFFHADRIRTPTLFMGGEKDFNVPVAGGEQMYQALRTLGVPTELVVYPGQYHSFTRPTFLKDRAERIGAWFDRYLKSGP